MVQVFILTRLNKLAKAVLLDAPVALSMKIIAYGCHANHVKAIKSLTLRIICAEYLVMALKSMIGLQTIALIVYQVNTKMYQLKHAMSAQAHVQHANQNTSAHHAQLVQYLIRTCVDNSAIRLLFMTMI